MTHRAPVADARAGRPSGGLVRSVRSEVAKLSWRSPLWYAVVPLAIIVPVAVNVAIAKAAQLELINGGGGMDTDNAAYWIMTFSTFFMMTGIVTSFCREYTDATVEIVFAIQPRRWMLPIAKLVVYGGISACVVGATTLGILWGFPLLFPDVWGRVDLFSSEGIRLWIGIPVYTVLVLTLGLGLAILVPRPGLVIMIVLLWKFGVEKLVTFIQGDIGLLLARYSPFANAEYGAGQFPAFEPPFGPNVSLAYFGAIAVALLATGLVRLGARDVVGD